MTVQRHRAAQLLSRLRALRTAAADSTRVFVGDVGRGLLEVSHNSLALFGLLVLGGVLLVASGRDVRHAVEAQALGWLQARHEARFVAPPSDEPDLSEPDAIARATASDPGDLSRQQARVAVFLSRQYRVAPEPVSRLVQEAWDVGERMKIDPALILAVMAVESSFNPFAQSAVGAQGLMQVMTKVHDAKYVAFGGRHAAFDPVTNLRVGAQVLKECIARAGSVEAGLRYYVGAANGDDSGYVLKVLSAQNVLRQLAGWPPRPIVPALIAPPARPADDDGASDAAPGAAAATPTAPPVPTAPVTTPVGSDQVALLR